MAAASAAVCRERDSIHFTTEVDITAPRRLMSEHREATGESLSFTAYVVRCLAQAVQEHPGLNSLISRGRLVMLSDITVGVLVERVLDGERIPEPMAIKGADRKSVGEITRLLREARDAPSDRLGGLSGATWVRFVPSFLFKLMIRIASRNVKMCQRYGVITVTSVGMFAPGPVWLVPLSASTVAVSVGGAFHRPVLVDGVVEDREHLSLTLSFDHDIVDGAPAARFVARMRELVAGGEVLTS
jgi:pyruvate/2-oxoglutarate dehydrogenase complex dihydrolipoamide acyltransferase (E2) component